MSHYFTGKWSPLVTTMADIIDDVSDTLIDLYLNQDIRAGVEQ